MSVAHFGVAGHLFGWEPLRQRKRRTPVEEYLHAVPDHLCGLVIGKDGNSIREIKAQSGATVYKDTQPPSIPGMSIFVIRGSRVQIMEAIRLICQKSGTKELISAYAQAFWLEWVLEIFPKLDSQAYFLPAVFIKRVPLVRQEVAGQHVLVPRLNCSLQDEVILNAHVPRVSNSTISLIHQPPLVQETDISDDSALERVLFCLSKMAEAHGDVFVALSQLKFGDYLAEPSFTAAAALLPSSANLPAGLPQNYRQGDFDVLVIHRLYGLVVCEVKSLGHSIDKMSLSREDVDAQVQDKLRKAAKQLDKAQAVLSHLVSDICPGLRITKVVVFANLTRRIVTQAFAADPEIIQDLHQFLGARDPTDIQDVFVCSEELSDPTTPWDVSDLVLKQFRRCWERRVASSGPDCQMTPTTYKTLVARFCGPATTVTVPCITSPRLAVKTLGQAVSVTGDCHTAQLTLFPEQVHLLNWAPPLVFVTGPPGTGKTVVLLLMAIEWLRQGHHVYIMSTCRESLAACHMLRFLVQQKVQHEVQGSAMVDRLHLLKYSLLGGTEVQKDIQDVVLKQEGSLHVIADEAGPDDEWRPKPNFRSFCENLLSNVPGLHLWAASCYHALAPAGWQVEVFTRPLRNPPVVIREVQESDEIGRDVQPYTDLPLLSHTDGPVVKRIYHQGDGHVSMTPGTCEVCGKEVGDFLKGLHVGDKIQTSPSADKSIGSAITFGYRKPTSVAEVMYPPDLEFRDVLVLCVGSVKDNEKFVRGMKPGLQVNVVKTEEDLEDVATARSDVIWVTCGTTVRGVERKVVVCVRNEQTQSDRYNRLYPVSRCVSQLVLVAPSSLATSSVRPGRLNSIS